MVSKIKKDPLLVIRLALGIAFIVHGVSKLQDVSGGMEMFAGMGLPGFVFVIVALVELLAGIGVLFNKFSKYSGYAIAIIMLGAIFLVKLNAGYLGGFEIDIAYLAMALSVAFSSCCCKGGNCSVEGHNHTDSE
jgi:putative oxidoreductase